MSPTDGALCQSVTLPSLLETGRGGVEANNLGLCQLIAYMKMVKKLTHSDVEIFSKGTPICFRAAWSRFPVFHGIISICGVSRCLLGIASGSVMMRIANVWCMAGPAAVFSSCCQIWLLE